MPESVLGLLLLFAAFAPGFVWVLVAERRAPQAERTPLLETAQLVAVGGLCSLAGAALVLFVARELDVIDPAALERDGPSYLLLHPLRAFVVLASAAAVSLTLAWAAARLAHWGVQPTQQAGTTWRQVLGAQKGSVAVATVGLANGRIVQGVVLAYEANPPTEPRDLALRQPLLEVDASSGAETAMLGDAFIVSEREIGWLSVDYRQPSSTSSS